MSIIFQRAADSLSQISQSLLCTVYCHRVLTLSSFNWNGERGDYPTYSGAQRFLMWLNTGRELRRIHRCVFSGNNWSSSRTQRRLITNSTANTCERKILCFLIIHRAETTAPSPRRGKWKKKKKACGGDSRFQPGRDWALHSAHSPIWSVFHSARSKDKDAFQCRMLHHTQLDSSHSLIHFSAYLYPFKPGDLTTPLRQAEPAHKQD